ncbi:hypothetical protein FXO37_00142 [Capsicum annuum]|nr:hypothetical protein FXO37_00142 [Capsicum annuum]
MHIKKLHKMAAYHLSPGEELKTPIKEILKDAQSYFAWKESMLSALSKKHKDCFVDGTLRRPSEKSLMSELDELRDKETITELKRFGDKRGVDARAECELEKQKIDTNIGESKVDSSLRIPNLEMVYPHLERCRLLLETIAAKATGWRTNKNPKKSYYRGVDGRVESELEKQRIDIDIGERKVDSSIRIPDLEVAYPHLERCRLLLEGHSYYRGVDTRAESELEKQRNDTDIGERKVDSSLRAPNLEVAYE